MLVVTNFLKRITHSHAICQQKPLAKVCCIVYTFMLSYIYQVLEKDLKTGCSLEWTRSYFTLLEEIDD
jgi:hypothetical protein